MNISLRVPLNTNAEQMARLQALQNAFAQVCNALAPTVQLTRVWNRVALHHLTYHKLRKRFPELGSQMVCNAIYSVSRTCRVVFQHPQSPFNLKTYAEKPLPLLRFSNNCPVYFDRHTLSIKGSKLSLFTLDGRMHFELTLPETQLSLFKVSKLSEISLTCGQDGLYQLAFWLEDQRTLTEHEAQAALEVQISVQNEALPAALMAQSPIPDYVSLEVAA